MYIVWRHRPVKGQGGGPFLQIDPDFLQRLTCWMPLRCEHRGTGRVAHTPLVVVSERRDGKPRQRALERFPTIRSCCIADPFNRAAWWYRVELVMSSWSDSLSSDPQFVDYSRDAPDMIRKLRSVVPRPTPAGVAAFIAHRLAREAEYKAEEQAEWASWRAQAEGQSRDREDIRDRQEQARRAHEQTSWGFQSGGRHEDCFAMLGIPADSAVAQIKARYRDLAKVHHPDRGGDGAEFNRINTAYEEALGVATAKATA